MGSAIIQNIVTSRHSSNFNDNYLVSPSSTSTDNNCDKNSCSIDNTLKNRDSNNQRQQQHHQYRSYSQSHQLYQKPIEKQAHKSIVPTNIDGNFQESGTFASSEDEDTSREESTTKYCTHCNIICTTNSDKNHPKYHFGVVDISPAENALNYFRRKENMDATSSREKREHLYKILVIGELGTGKTSFIKRYVHQFFSQNYRATIGVDFALKVLNWDQNTIIRLQLWDIAGQERFGNMTRVYYKEAVGAFIVFDVTRNATFDAVVKWKQDLDTKVQLSNGNPIPCILLANKCDQPKQGIVSTPAKMDEYVKENGFAGWFETSAKENINIEEAARALVNKILQNDTLTNGGGGGGSGGSDDTDRFGLENRTYQPPKEKCSC